ncbi:hypothetical protein QQ020_09705 [Fulvivirgaceae bacterium BMA12]|uniref:Outer membrane protein beta-barrel domain-containing protein n=1 Tax=Agaribacillus aureus TaxID=3051825 RepID=A0ABT8L3M2_9BACT|nr:hypothetical protein [Fulvivirgaceae bacterium BMA12]
MINKLVVALIVTILSFHAYGQKEIDIADNPSFFDRVYVGGNVSMQFGTFTYLELSPLAGYMITNMFSAGLGVTYRYISIRDVDFNTSIYGGRVFARHNLGEQFFLYTEYESLRNELRFGDGTRREWVPGFFVGGGLFQPIGNSGVGFAVTALYNFSYDEIRSPYNSPWVFRVGFTL